MESQTRVTIRAKAPYHSRYSGAPRSAACSMKSKSSTRFRAAISPTIAAVSPVHAVTTLAIILATAVAVLGQLYRVERRIPICEPDAALVLLVVSEALLLVYRLS